LNGTELPPGLEAQPTIAIKEKRTSETRIQTKYEFFIFIPPADLILLRAYFLLDDFNSNIRILPSDSLGRIS